MRLPCGCTVPTTLVARPGARRDYLQASIHDFIPFSSSSSSSSFSLHALVFSLQLLLARILHIQLVSSVLSQLSDNLAVGAIETWIKFFSGSDTA